MELRHKIEKLFSSRLPILILLIHIVPESPIHNFGEKQIKKQWTENLMCGNTVGYMLKISHSGPVIE